MAETKDTQTPEIAAAATVAPPEAAAVKTAAPAEAPSAAPERAVSGEAAKADPMPVAPIMTTAAEAQPAPAVTPAISAKADTSRWRLPPYAPLAAGIALAVAVGAAAGATATAALMHGPAASASSAAEESRAIQAAVAQLGSELTALKTGLSAAQRSTTVQFVKLTERLDRAEKSQTEPAAKLAKITEALDRLEKRQQQPAAQPVHAADPQTTASVVAKEESRPPVADGWRLRDFYSGRAVVESRNGALFEIAPGSNLPGLGRVESIKRENGKVVVVAKNGIITASAEPRRPPAYIPYRDY
jgi:hypothetical protein